MLIPLGTDRTARRRPVVTEGLIVVNLIVYLAGLAGAYGGWFDLETFVTWGSYSSGRFNPLNLITYQFLHDPGGLGHIAFNMLFLWVFGSAVEMRLSRVSFLLFYLMGGAAAAIVHGLSTPAPVIGASGAVAAVTGAFLALFPRSRIRVLLFLFIIGVYSIPSVWFIAIYFVIDLLRAAGSLFGGGGQVAYLAHLAGYVFGFGLAFGLLALGIIPREEFDVFYLFRQARRRRAFREATKAGASVWEPGSARPAATPKAVNVESRSSTRPAVDERAVTARAEISRLVSRHDLPGAAARYRDALADGINVVLDERKQLDVANQLYAEGDAETAARAYERFLERYAMSDEANHVRLLLATLYVRRLGRTDRARALIAEIKAKLTDRTHAALADQLLAEMGAA